MCHSTMKQPFHLSHFEPAFLSSPARSFRPLHGVSLSPCLSVRKLKSGGPCSLTLCPDGAINKIEDKYCPDKAKPFTRRGRKVAGLHTAEDGRAPEGYGLIRAVRLFFHLRRNLYIPAGAEKKAAAPYCRSRLFLSSGRDHGRFMLRAGVEVQQKRRCVCRIPA